MFGQNRLIPSYFYSYIFSIFFKKNLHDYFVQVFNFLKVFKVFKIVFKFLKNFFKNFSNVFSKFLKSFLKISQKFFQIFEKFLEK